MKTVIEQGPLVSVLMPVRNGAAHIDEAIASIVAQTYKNWELVVVDDGSVDHTPLRLAAWAKSDSRIVVISPGSIGLVAALNAAVTVARGEYFARFDSDDVAHPKRLAKQVSYMERHPDVVVLGSAIRLFGERFGVLFTPLTDWGCRGRLFFENCFAHPSTMIRRSKVVDLFPLYEVRCEFAEDLALWIRLAPYGKFANLPFPFIRYRVHGGQISREKARILRDKHAKFIVEQWRKMGVCVSPDEFEKFRWPNFCDVGRWGWVRDSVRIARALAPFYGSRYAPQAFWWVLRVFVQNIIKALVLGLRYFL